VESLPLLQPAWQETAAQNGSKKPRPLRTTASWVGSSWNPLNSKVVARDGPSHAAARLAPDRVAAWPCSLGRRNLAAESNLSSPEPYSWRAGSLSQAPYVVVSSRGATPGSLAGARLVVHVFSLLLRECECVATFVILVRNRDRAGMAMVQEIVIVHLRLIVANKDG
jgi:hypothetical protein